MSRSASAAVATALLAAAPTRAAFVIPGPDGKSSQARGHSTAEQLVPGATTQDARPSWTASTSGAGAALTAAATCSVLGMVAVRRSAAASARATVPSAPRRLVQVAAFESELGVQDPVGFWDPVGFTADGDELAFKRRRCVELKHGRISMLATMGYITPEVAGKFPGYLSPSMDLKFADIPNGLGAITKIPALGWVQIFAYGGLCELTGPKTRAASLEDYASITPGDYGWKVLTSADPEELRKKLAAEIANSRLAMVAILGMFFQDGLTGSAWGDWALYTDSPLRAFEDELGVQAPFGFWDPAGFTKEGNVEAFKRRRATEVKHGRVSMLATMGYITPELTGKFPGYLAPTAGLKFQDVPNGLAALSKVPAGGIMQIILYCLYCESSSGFNTENPDLAWKPPLLATSDEASKTRRLNAEIANGRLAMMAIIGMFYQDGLTGSAWGDWALYTDSPLRAFESELGVQDPVGFWDPLGFSTDGDVTAFKRRRSVELKHGRICMLATMGYITPELTGKWPGDLSPSEGVKFADIPNGLAAISKVPALGWAQIVAYCGFCELSAGSDDWKTGTPGDFGWKVLTSSDPEERQKKLSAEIANGRLAMVAIIGMFFQDGLTGSAWGDWALYTASPLRARESAVPRRFFGGDSGGSSPYAPAFDPANELGVLRAFEDELGVQAPFGFWDPVGLTKDGDVEAFNRRRVTEVKHGRVSMLATMGYITPEITGKFPGYLSPSTGLRFEDVPNGLAALSKIPGGGLLQIALYCLYCEASSGFNTASPDLGWKPPVLATSDPALKTRRLNAEIANGRLAMMAIIGMFYQDGLTGSAWGDWAMYTDSPLRAFETELGVQPPVGFWDPAGFSRGGDAELFKRHRGVELKHGRLSMFACLGYIVPEYLRFPGSLSPYNGITFSDVPNGLKAFSVVPFLGWAQIFLFCGFVETALYKADPARDPGDFERAGILGVPNGSGPIADEESRKQRLSAELANGRLAMMAIIGMFFQDGLTGSAWGDWALYTGSPLRAFESELGVQDPVGFWDPMGFTADGDELAFKRRRCVELKHGRISMLATMGYITPEVAGKFPGYLSPSMDLKFADIPNGLGAITKIPALGWVQIFAYGGLCELTGPKTRAASLEDYASITPGDYGWKVLTSADPEELRKKLAAEIANSRLAMVAILGMFFQDGLTGSAWGDWALYTDSPLRAFEDELGVQAPFGFWDPAGFTKDGNVEAFKRRRATEVKHGRVSMLATMGYITPELTGKFPGYLAPSAGLKFQDVPNGLAALSKVPAGGVMQIILYCLYCEASSNFNTENPDLAWKPPLLATSDEASKTRRLNAEIANGRLAMMAIIGMFYQDGLTGSAWGDWALYTDSPLRAFESELGVQDPVGFWDPLGFATDGDVTAFKRRRSVELKHGRICMLATMGYITPELTGKWPGDLSPSEGVKFADIPNGLAAISKVPALGWAQIVAYCGFCELSAGSDDWKTGTPGDFGWKVLTSSDPEERQKKLSAEIANGRLAMVAIIGMFFQDGLTGSAWGDWALYTASPLRARESAVPRRFFGSDSGGSSSYYAPAFDPANELGVQASLGFWDPLGLAADGDEATFKRRRSVELKHGRVCMIACIGYIVPEYFKWPGEISPSLGLKFADIPNGLAALSQVPALGWVQMVFFAGIMEGCFGVGEYKTGTPGEYGWKVLTSDDPAEKQKKLCAEIANGRLAMVAIIGMFFQDGLTGSAWGDWATYTDSPLRAFENELGVQAPFGFWDPAGLSKDGDEETFKRRRQTELKHGRVSMLACLGYIVPEAVGKFPGTLSPSLDLKFVDVPNGLAALSKVPGAGLLQMFLFVAGVESTFLTQDPARPPGDFANAGILGVPRGSGMPNGEARTRKLNAEIANGRLAMMAIIGMFYQDGLTGSAWGDWALYTDSPLRAFESELGVQDPVGFWDPVGFTADGDELAFKRRRCVELKHGRISMLATMGYITPEVAGKFPGYLSPSMDLKFADIPNGLGAITKIPALGWVQIFAYGGLCELTGPKTRAASLEDYASITPGDYGWKVLTSADPEELRKKLAAEIANSRLAMVAILGMFFQDGLTGSAWGDWALYTDSPLR